MYEFLLYLVLFTHDGVKHEIVDKEYQTMVECKRELKKLNMQLKTIDTTHLMGVTTGCKRRHATEVKL